MLWCDACRDTPSTMSVRLLDKVNEHGNILEERRCENGHLSEHEARFRPGNPGDATEWDRPV